VTDAGGRLAVSVQARLVRRAKTMGADPNVVLVRYATERLLYRLSRSEHASRFILKGALLLLVWLGETFRPTRDADLLGFGELSDDALVACRLGPARLKLRFDVGIGDAVEPAAEWLEYPTLLDQPRPRLRAYRPETVIAEKLHAMVLLAARNSRMRDFFDIHALATRQSFKGGPLARAIRATFDRRRTRVPGEAPIALTPSFAELPDKRTQWKAFLRKNAITASRPELETVVAELARFLLPPLAAAAGETDFDATWLPRGPWRP